MKKNEFLQIKGLESKELLLKVKDLKKEIDSLVMDKNMKKLKDLKSIFKKRKDLAQILTVIRQKDLLVKLENEASKTGKKIEATTDESVQKVELKKKGKTKLSKK
jgi:ribosomal protein L29